MALFYEALFPMGPFTQAHRVGHGFSQIHPVIQPLSESHVELPIHRFAALRLPASQNLGFSHGFSMVLACLSHAFSMLLAVFGMVLVFACF